MIIWRVVREGTNHGCKLDETTDVDIVYTFVTSLELNKLTTEIEKIEPAAFIVMKSVKDTKGRMIKKRSLKH